VLKLCSPGVALTCTPWLSTATDARAGGGARRLLTAGTGAASASRLKCLKMLLLVSTGGGAADDSKLKGACVGGCVACTPAACWTTVQLKPASCLA
jgi:hypothetical protein